MKRLLNISLGMGLVVFSLLAYEKIVKLKYEALFNEILDEVNLL